MRSKKILTELPLLHAESKTQALQCGCSVSDVISGTDEQIEAFMSLQNPTYQVAYNQRKHLNGRWNMLSRKLENALPHVTINTNNILMSVSAVQSGKTVSTGFHPIEYQTLEELAENMHIYSHSPSIYSPLLRWDKYSNTMKWDYRRRMHTVSFTGNMLVYDFDDGKLSFSQAVEVAKNILNEYSMPSLVIRSKSDPKYTYDRFKMAVQTNIIYPSYAKDDVPEGYVKGDDYKATYQFFAKKFGLYDFMDKSTKDISRLIARVTNTDSERREYVVIR